MPQMSSQILREGERGRGHTTNSSALRYLAAKLGVRPTPPHTRHGFFPAPQERPEVPLWGLLPSLQGDASPTLVLLCLCPGSCMGQSAYSQPCRRGQPSATQTAVAADE